MGRRRAGGASGPSAAARDHDEAFAEVFAAHRDDVVRLAYLLCGDPDAARDAAAEAFARTYDQWRRGRVDRVEAYVRRAVVNHVKNDFRRRGRQRAFEGQRFGDDRGATSQTDRADATDAMWQLIRGLPQRQRTAVVLRFWEDLSVAEVADAMGCPVGTAKSLLSRAVARLRAHTESGTTHEEVCDER